MVNLRVYGSRVLPFGGAGADTPAAPPAPPPPAVAETPAPATQAPTPLPEVKAGQAVSLLVLNELIPGLLGVLVVGGVVWDATHGVAIPTQLSDMGIAIAAFYFGVRGRGPVGAWS